MALLTEKYFHCPEWPGCGCPDGTAMADCPGYTVPASSGSGGPAAAPLKGTASPAAAAIDPDEAVTDFRQAITGPARAPDRFASEVKSEAGKAMAEAAEFRRRAISCAVIADINALLARGDRAIKELSAIQCELAMIRKDMGDLLGLPVDPAAAARKAG